MQAAEEMLAVVREVYPSAWAGEAPGKKLRANNAARRAAAAAPAPRSRRCRCSRAAAQAAAAPLRAARPLRRCRPAAVAPTPAAPQRRAASVRRHAAAARLKHEPEPEPFVLTDDDPNSSRSICRSCIRLLRAR